MKKTFTITIVLLCSFSFLMGQITDDSNSGTFVDERDGHEYKWVRIGEQIWMAENLAFLPSINIPPSYSDSIPHYYVPMFQGTELSEAIKNDLYDGCGVLYNWPAAIAACPSGWHLPSNSDWEELAEFISNEKGPFERDEDSWDNVGKYLKTTFDWMKPAFDTVDYPPKNEFGFSARPCGFTDEGGIYRGVGGFGGFWGSTLDSTNSAFCWHLHPMLTYFHFFSSSFEIGKSVRCVKDAP